MNIHRSISSLASVVGLMLVLSGVATSPARAGVLEALFAPRAELWERWTRQDANDTRTIDHAAWTRFLARYLSRNDDGVNRVAYARVGAKDKHVLAAYIDALAAVPIGGHNRDEQLAYWINLYNALTVKVVLDHYPVASIRDIDISPGWFSDGPWGKKLIEVEGVALSLNDIEHRILRPIWRDPRIHYAVNCAALGCPNLRMVAFTGANAEEDLDRAARDFVNHRRGVTLRDGSLVVSSIYVWFQEDFGAGEMDVIAHLKRYAEPALRNRLTTVDGIDDDEYDWILNDAGHAAPVAEG